MVTDGKQLEKELAKCELVAAIWRLAPGRIGNGRAKKEPNV
jgi:hypothetical protein